MAQTPPVYLYFPDLINFLSTQNIIPCTTFMQCPCTTFILLEPIYLNIK